MVDILVNKIRLTAIQVIFGRRDYNKCQVGYVYQAVDIEELFNVASIIVA